MKSVTTTSSNISPCWVYIVPYFAVWVGCCATAIPFMFLYILSVISMACGPLIRTTAIPPTPGAVDMAHIVSVVSALMVLFPVGIVACFFYLVFYLVG